MDRVADQLQYYCVMETSFYKELQEAELVSEGSNAVAIALASRDICSVSSFLKRGHDTLDALMNEFRMHTQFDMTHEARLEVMRDERLLLPIQVSRLRALRSLLFLRWKDRMMCFNFIQNNHRGGGLRETAVDSLGLLLTRLDAHSSRKPNL